VAKAQGKALPSSKQLNRDNAGNIKIPFWNLGEIIIEQAHVRCTGVEQCGYPFPVQLPDSSLLPSHPLAMVH